MTKRGNEEVKAIIEDEGLGYAVQSYMDEDSIEDPELAKAWKEARAALDKIEELLKDVEPKFPD